MAVAYVNHGRWVADCPRPGGLCLSAEWLDNPAEPLRWRFQCTNCGYGADIAWPREAAGIEEVLGKRPVPQTRNWFPHDHPRAIRSGTEHGLTPDHLRQQNRAMGDPA